MIQTCLPKNVIPYFDAQIHVDVLYLTINQRSGWCTELQATELRKKCVSKKYFYGYALIGNAPPPQGSNRFQKYFVFEHASVDVSFGQSYNKFGDMSTSGPCPTFSCNDS